MKPASADAKASSSNPLLSIVLTSYTDERLEDVFELLESIKTQTYPHIEIVYIIERSTGLLHRLQSYLKEEAIRNIKVIFDSGDLGLCARRDKRGTWAVSLVADRPSFIVQTTTPTRVKRNDLLV